jgi:hypothetical protein
MNQPSLPQLVEAQTNAQITQGSTENLLNNPGINVQNVNISVTEQRYYTFSEITKSESFSPIAKEASDIEEEEVKSQTEFGDELSFLVEQSCQMQEKKETFMPYIY